MRGDEAIDTVMHFIDDAILIGLSRVRILHGTGTGILRQLIRQYLATVPNVKKAKDEHVQFGGAGITVVDWSNYFTTTFLPLEMYRPALGADMLTGRPLKS